MKKYFSFLLSALCVYMNIRGAAVSYQFNGGRFGDQLVTYVHARWVAYKFNLPLLYKRFDYSDQLMVDSMHQQKYERPTISISAQVRYKNGA